MLVGFKIFVLFCDRFGVRWGCVGDALVLFGGVAVMFARRCALCTAWSYFGNVFAAVWRCAFVMFW